MEILLDDYFFFFINSIVGLTFLIAGLFLWKKPPKRINGLYGYRTKRSMSSQSKWDFAQTYSGKLMTLMGLLLIALSQLEFIINMSSNVKFMASMILIIAVVIILFVSTESKLKSLS